MRVFLLISSLLSLMILGIGTKLSNNNPMFWLASGQYFYQIARASLGVVLFAQLCTQPPRNLFLRIISGLVGAIATIWAIDLTYGNHMMLLDSLSILAGGIATSITALEKSPIDKKKYMFLSRRMALT